MGSLNSCDPHRKQNFTSLRQHGTKQIRPDIFVTMSLLIDQCIKIYSDFLSRGENLNSSGVCLTTLKTCRNLIRIVTSGKMCH